MKNIFILNKTIMFSCFSFFISVIYSCSNKINTESNTEKKTIKSNYSLEINEHLIATDPFDPNFINELEKNISGSEYEHKNNVKELLIKLKDKNEYSTLEKKYQLLYDLIKNLPKPYLLDKKNNYENNYNVILEHLKINYDLTAKSIPKNIHYIWVGGTLGEIQKDYIKIWAKLNPDYKINIWYDSENMFVNETNKLIKEYSPLVVNDKKNDLYYEKILADKIISIQNALFEKLISNKSTNSKLTLDQERYLFIENILYNKKDVTFEKINSNIEKMNNDIISLKNEFSNIDFKDIKNEKQIWTLKSNYEQELYLRGNLAGASDSARVEILASKGGIYMDADILPALKPYNYFMTNNTDEISKNYLKNSFRSISLIFYEQLFNYNENFLPSRTKSNFYLEKFFDQLDYINSLTTEQKSHIKNILKDELNKLKNINNLESVFNKINDVKIREGEFRTAEDSNNFIASHSASKNSDWIQLLKNKIKENYLKLNNYEKNNPNLYYPKKSNYILINDKAYIRPNLESVRDFDSKALSYRYDTLLTDSRATIAISGPSALYSVYEDIYPESIENNRDFKKTKIIESLSEFNVKNKVFNNATEEDAKSSWAKKSIAPNGEYFPPRNLIFQLNLDENTKNAANFIYNKEFLSSKEKYSTKKVSYIDNENLKIKEELRSYGEKLNIYLVGHAELKNNIMTIGDLNPEELANRLYEITTINKKTLIHHIDIISCNPTGNINDTKNMETYAQSLLEKLNHLEMPIDIISVRTGMIKIDSNGNELSKNNYGIFTNAKNENKLYVIRKSENEFLSINTSELEKLLHTEKISRFNKFSNLIKNITSRKTDALGDFTTTIQKIKNSYQLSIQEEDISKANSFEQKSSLFNQYYQTKYKTSISSKIAKYSFKGIEKFTNAANKYNIFINFINMPNSLSMIQQSFKNGFIVEGTRDASNLIINNADLSLDLLKYSKSNEYWLHNKNILNGITKTQIGLNLISSGFEFWQAADLFKAGNLTDDENKKLDLYINASLTSARAVSSLGTALLLPLSAKAGPIGAAIGYTIMFSQGVYNSVRTAEELRRLGFNENDITMKSILKFFGHYDTSEDPAYITKIESNKLINEIIPNILNLKNKDYFENLNRTGNNSLFYFKKLIYPKVDLYIPFTYETRIVACAYGGCGISKTPGVPIPNKSHSCLTNNSYIGNDVNINLKNDILSKHNNSINTYHSFLTKKETNTPSLPNNQYYSQANIQYINHTVTCPSVNSNTTMIERIDNPSIENKEKLKSIPDSKKANLFLVGFGDQGIHGNMISSIVADQNDINLFNIHPSTYMLHLVGGNKEDVFEFYDIVQSKENKKGFIDGGEGIDTIHLQGISNKNLTVNLNNNKSNDFPQFRNIENVFGSNQDDVIHGNESDNSLFGNSGNDSINGNEGNDNLFPGAGFDKLNGGKGNDTYVILLKDLTNNDISKIMNDYFTITNEIKIMEDKINNISESLLSINNNNIHIFRSIKVIDSSYNSSMNKLSNAVQTSKQNILNIKNKYIELKDLSNSIRIKINNINSELKDYEFKNTSIHKELLIIKESLQKISNFEINSNSSLDEIDLFMNKINQFHTENTLSDEAIRHYQNKNNYYVSEALESNKKNSIYLKKITLSQLQPMIHEKSSNLMNTLNLIKNDLFNLIKNYGIIIDKSQSILDGMKIIDNYDDSYDSNTENGLDTIMTDIKNLVTRKSNSHLYIGFYENEKFIPAIQVSNYFQSEKNQHLIISDIKGNIYTSKNGNLYIENENNLEITPIDTFKITHENSIIQIDKPIFGNLENILKAKNIIGTLKNDEIHGDQNNNFISGVGGFDKLYGHDGDDTLSATLASHIPKDYSEENILEFFKNLLGYPTTTKLNGGKGFDTYILNFSPDLYSSFENSNYLEIDNEDENESMDNLYIHNSNIKITNIIFESIKENLKSDLQISFQDVLSKKYYYINLKNWFISSKYRHLQIQIGKQITLPSTLIEQITKVIENTNERFHFNLSIKNNYSREIIFHKNSFNEINSNFKLNNLTNLNYIFHVNDARLAKLKISHFENDLYLQLNYPNSDDFIFTIIREYYPNKLNLENLMIGINSENLIDPKNFKNMVSELDEGSFIEIYMIK